MKCAIPSGLSEEFVLCQLTDMTPFLALSNWLLNPEMQMQTVRVCVCAYGNACVCAGRVAHAQTLLWMLMSWDFGSVCSLSLCVNVWYDCQFCVLVQIGLWECKLVSVFLLLFTALSLFSRFAALLWNASWSRVLDEDFYKQPFSELIGYVYVAKLTSFLFTYISH